VCRVCRAVCRVAHEQVALNYQVQLNRRLVYFPVCLTSYQYNGKLYRVRTSPSSSCSCFHRFVGVGSL
jgi:hypothetical protein